MGRRIYVANLGVSTGERQLRQLFTPFGAVQRIAVPTAPETGQPSGFAFVEMETYSEATRAIAELDQTEMGGQRLTVKEAHPAVMGAGHGSQLHERGFVTAYAV